MVDNYAGYDQPATVDKAFRTRDAGAVGGQAVEDQYVVDSDRDVLIAAIQAIDANVATQATLAAAKAALDDILQTVETHEAHLAALSTTDFATQDTVAQRFGLGHTTSAQPISTSGDNAIVTPASGKLIRLHWIGMSTSEDNSEEVLAIVKFGSSERYRWNLGVPGAFSHWQMIDGAVDEPLIVNLSAAQPVQVNCTFEEWS